MKTRTIGETIQCLHETVLPIEFTRTGLYRSLVASALTCANHPSEHTYQHFQRSLWKIYGYLEAKIEGEGRSRSYNEKSEAKIRIFLSRLESFFA
jgi:hypothetical protein